MGRSFLKILVFFLLFLRAPSVLAVIEITNPLVAEDIPQLIDRIIDFIFLIATAIAPLMIIIAAFYFLTSAGNPRQIETAKNIILYTLVGYAIILVSKGLVLVIREILGG